MSEPPLKRRRLSPSLPLESPHEPGTSEIFNPNFDEDAMAQQMMDTLFQGALDALEQPQTGSTEGMNDYEQQWEPSGEPPMDGMREEWDDFIGEPEEQSERADQGKALEVELFGEDDTDGGTYAQREKQQQNQGDTWPEDQNQEDELASAAASMLQDSLAQAMAQHGLPEMSQQEEEDLADAAAGMLNDSLAQALEGWDEGEFRLQETEEPSIRGGGAAMASQQKLQQSQSLHRPSPPTRLPSSRTSPPAAASAHPSEPFQLHLPRPGASKAPPSSEAHIHAPSQPEAYPNRAPSPDAMNIFNAALQNAKSRLDRHPSPTADDILKTSLQAALASHAQGDLHGSGSPSPEDILNASIKAGVAALDHANGNGMDFDSNFHRPNPSLPPPMQNDNRSALDILADAIAAGLKGQEGLPEAEVNLEDELQQMLMDTANAASGSNIKSASGPAIPEELAFDVNKMLNEAVTSAAHQEFQFVGALKRGRPKGSVKKEPTVYTCQFPGCGKEFPKLYSLKSHQTAHQTAKGFSCRFCDAKFNRAHDQKRHERLHEATKVYVCQGCNKDFTRLDALKRHKTNLRVLPACKDTPIIKQDRTGPVPIDIPLNPSRAPRANSNASFPSSGTASHPMPAAGSGQQALHNFSNAHPGQRPPPQQFEFVNELPPPRKHIAPFPPLARATQGHRPSVNEEYDDESILMAQGEEHDEGGDIPVMNGNGEGDVED